MSRVSAPWVRIGARVRSAADLRARAARAASGFALAGVAPGDVVAVVLRNDFPMIEATVGAGMAGAYVVPVVHADLLPSLAAILPPGVLVLVAETPAELRCAYPGRTRQPGGHG